MSAVVLWDRDGGIKSYVAAKRWNADLPLGSPIFCFRDTCYLANSISSVILEKVMVTHLVKKFPVFCGTRRFIAVLTRARHCHVLRAIFPSLWYIYETFASVTLWNLSFEMCSPSLSLRSVYNVHKMIASFGGYICLVQQCVSLPKCSTHDEIWYRVSCSGELILFISVE